MLQEVRIKPFILLTSLITVISFPLLFTIWFAEIFQDPQ